MKKTFQAYKLTDDQATFLEKLDIFLTRSGGGCFLLKGYAGTGKTFMMKGLTEHLSMVQRSFKIMAPTGRGAKVISQKTNIQATTIHKAIFHPLRIKEYKEKDYDGSETFKYYFDITNNNDDARTVYIIDEASMISDKYSEEEFIRFGSGRLLNDLLKYVNLDHNDHQKKIIFIGDGAQLPPVNSNISPALDKKYLQGKYNLDVCEFELTEVLRQKYDSGILKNSTKIRDYIAAARFNVLDVDTAHDDVIPVPQENLLAEYVRVTDGKIKDGVVIIAYSNKQVTDYNNFAREYFFPGQKDISVGDKVLIVKNNYLHEEPLLNGDFGRIMSVGSGIENREVFLNKPEGGKRVNITVNLVFRNIVVRIYNLEGKPHDIHCKIIENLLHSGEACLSSDEIKALYVDFKNRHSYLKAGSREFKEALINDPFYNCLQIKFGYAITCHKAQGGEWENVFVDFKATNGFFNETYFRWIYTALTRTQGRLFTINEPHLKITKPIKVPEVISPESPQNVYARRAEDIDRKVFFEMPADKLFLKSILYLVNEKVRGTGIHLDGIIHNQYCEHYGFSKGEQAAEILIYYNAKQVVSSTIVKQGSDKQLAEELNFLLACLKGKKFITETREEAIVLDAIDFPPGAEYFNEFHQSIVKKLASTDINILEVVHPTIYQAKYTYSRNGHRALVNYHFNGKGRLTRPIPDHNLTTSNQLLQEVIAFTQ